MEETGTPETMRTPAWLRPSEDRAQAERHHIWAPRPLHRSIAWSPTGDARHAPDGDYEVFVKQRALETMYRHVLAAHHADEPFGFLFGDLCEDRDARRRYVVISRVVPSPYPLDEWESQQMADQALRVLQRESARSEGVLAGWYHRHRTGPALLTEADEGTHRAHFGEPWQVAFLFVTDPESPAGGCFQPRTYGVTAHNPLPFHVVANSASLMARGLVRTVLDWTNVETDSNVVVEPLPRPAARAGARPTRVAAAAPIALQVPATSPTPVAPPTPVVPPVQETVQPESPAKVEPEVTSEPPVLEEVSAPDESAVADESVISQEAAEETVFELLEPQPHAVPDVAPDSEAHFEIVPEADTEPEAEAEVPPEPPLPELSAIVPRPAPVAAPAPQPAPQPVPQPEPARSASPQPRIQAAPSVILAKQGKKARLKARRSLWSRIAEIFSVVAAVAATGIGAWPLLSAPPQPVGDGPDLAALTSFVLPMRDRPTEATPFDDADPLASPGRGLRAAIGRYETVSGMFERGRLTCAALRDARGEVDAAWTVYEAALGRLESRSSVQALRDRSVAEGVDGVESDFGASGCGGP